MKTNIQVKLAKFKRWSLQKGKSISKRLSNFSQASHKTIAHNEHIYDESIVLNTKRIRYWSTDKECYVEAEVPRCVYVR